MACRHVCYGVLGLERPENEGLSSGPRRVLKGFKVCCGCWFGLFRHTHTHTHMHHFGITLCIGEGRPTHADSTQMLGTDSCYTQGSRACT